MQRARVVLSMVVLSWLAVPALCRGENAGPPRQGQPMMKLQRRGIREYLHERGMQMHDIPKALVLYEAISMALLCVSPRTRLSPATPARVSKLTLRCGTGDRFAALAATYTFQPLQIALSRMGSGRLFLRQERVERAKAAAEKYLGWLSRHLRLVSDCGTLVLNLLPHPSCPGAPMRAY